MLGRPVTALAPPKDRGLSTDVCPPLPLLLLLQLSELAPALLLPVLSNLGGLLRPGEAGSSEERRAEGARLVGRMLGVPGTHFAADYPDLVRLFQDAFEDAAPKAREGRGIRRRPLPEGFSADSGPCAVFPGRG